MQTHPPTAIRHKQDPWVDLPTGAELADWSEADEVAYSQGFRQAQKLQFFANAFDFVRTHSLPGDYFEFGCHRARTFRMALSEARRRRMDQMKFFAFDSFEGLPEPEHETGIPGFFKGALKTSEDEFHTFVQKHGIYVDQIRTVKGYFDQSLTPTLQAQMLSSGARVALACVDCDFYESTVPVLQFLEPLLQEGSLLYIDDYFMGLRGSPLTGPAQAFKEFEEKSRFRFAPHMTIGWWGRSYLTYRSS